MEEEAGTRPRDALDPPPPPQRGSLGTAATGQVPGAGPVNKDSKAGEGNGQATAPRSFRNRSNGAPVALGTRGRKGSETGPPSAPCHPGSLNPRPPHPGAA